MVVAAKSIQEVSESIAINPATLKEIGRVPNTDMALMPTIFQKAREAQKSWATKSFGERKKYILRMRDYITENAEDISSIVSKSNGKSRIDALVTEVIPCSLAADWYAKNAVKYLKPKKLPGSSLLFFNKKNMLLRMPMGVVGIISPWNYPLSIPFGEIVMGLMAGNAILLKVAAATIMVGDAINKIVAAAELPDGLFYHVVGSGSAVSKSFFENGINKIFFTGSVATGKTLMASAAPYLTPLSLELGGKDPMIVLADADLERATNGACWAGYQNAGQTCAGIERVYVHESIYDTFVEIMIQKTKKLRHGVDRDFEIDMGSMTTKDQLQTVMKQVDAALDSGAKIVAQSSPTNNANGYFYPATLMTNVNHSMKIMTEETFGPVLPVMKFKDVEEAIRLANDSNYALTSSVWTKDIKLGKKIATRIEAGVTTINDHLYTHGQSETPWGGWKATGIGRTHSAIGLDEMTQPKVISWDLIHSKRNLWWYPFSKDTYNALLDTLRFVFPKSIGDFVSGGLKMTKYMVKKMFSSWKV
ncbi:MAG: aldehyde dehydrogenase family protein [Leptospiraceae bacterium]|nr:aldehyde dehydrogenase family protein [Leptospiraceae bacterium]